MAKLNINGKEYDLKFTIGFWRRIKEACGITKQNFEEKLNENFGEYATQIVIHSIVGNEKPELKTIEESLEWSVVDAFESAMIEGMTKAELEMLEIAKAQRDKKIKEFTDEKK